MLQTEITHCWHLGIDALLRGDEVEASNIWMSVMLDSTTDELEDLTNQLVSTLESSAIKFLQAGSYEAAKQCYKTALEVDEKFNNSVLKNILFWREEYIAYCQDKGYQFTTDWFSEHIPVWNQVLQPFISAPNLMFLEVGSWEGRSTCWLLDNVLLNDSSIITCIDTFKGSIEHEAMGLGNHVSSIEDLFDYNVERTGRSQQVQKKVSSSQSCLRSLPLDSFDFYYVDGSHIAADVLADVVLGWDLVKEGGIIIFDDYGWGVYQDQPRLHPKLAVDSFLEIYHDKIQLIYKGYQVLVKKTAC